MKVGKWVLIPNWKGGSYAEIKSIHKHEGKTFISFRFPDGHQNHWAMVNEDNNAETR